MRQPDSELAEKPLAGEKWILLTQVNQYQMQSTQTLHNKSLIVLALSLLQGFFVLALLLPALISCPQGDDGDHRAIERALALSGPHPRAQRVRQLCPALHPKCSTASLGTPKLGTTRSSSARGIAAWV